MNVELQASMTRGAAWMVLFKLSERGLGIASTLVLVRVLMPEDFGIVAMAVSFIAMAELLSAFGFDLALIQNQQAGERHYHAAWTCNVLLGLVITLVMIAAAHPISAFYGRPEVFWVVCALALGSTLGGLENIGVVAFRKELRFGREFAFLLSKKAFGVLITVPLALLWRNYWALVVGTLAARLIATFVSYLVHPFRPRFSLQGVGDLIGFSKWILLNSVLIFLKDRTTDFVIGSLHGPRALGLYNVSNEFSNLPLTELTAPVNRALIPGFAKIQHDPAGTRSAFGNAMAWLAMVVTPAAAGISAVAPHLVPVVLGAKWMEAVPLMEVLALAGALVAFHSPICATLIARGRPDRVVACHVAYVLVLIVALAVLLPRLGALGAAYAALTAALASSPVYLLQLKRHVGVGGRAVLAVIVRPVLASCVMVVAVRLLFPAPPAATLSDSVLSLCAGVGVGVVSYGVALAVLWLLAGRPAGVERQVLERATRALGRRRAYPG